MFHSRLVVGVLLIGLAVSVPVGAESADSPAVESHVHRAKVLAGEDLRFLSDGFLCQPAENAIITAARTIPGFLDPAAPAVEPFAAFDNLYYIGLHAVGTWVLDTGDGLILFDALNNAREVEEVLLPGLESFGLDPQDIKHLVITHAHFDHYGGAFYLQDRYGVQVMMSGPDWAALSMDISLPFALRAGYPDVVPPERDRVVADGEVLRLGNAEVQFVVTPGHTPGTLSTILTVMDGDTPRRVGMWGGQALPPRLGELNQMHNSLHRYWDLVQSEGVEGLISTHPWVVGAFELRAQGRADGGNPLLLGPGGVDRLLGIYDECIAAQFARSNARQLSGEQAHDVRIPD